MDKVWHLMEIFFVRKNDLLKTGGLVLLDLIDWVQQHFDGNSTSLSRTLLISFVDCSPSISIHPSRYSKNFLLSVPISLVQTISLLSIYLSVYLDATRSAAAVLAAEGALASCEYHPLYWDTIYKLLLQGDVRPAMDMITRHSQYQRTPQNPFVNIHYLIGKMPTLSPDVSSTAFYRVWNQVHL